MKKTFVGRVPRTFNKWFGCRLYHGQLTYVDCVRGKKWLVWGDQEFGPFTTILNWRPSELLFHGDQPVYAAEQDGEWRMFRGRTILGTSEREIREPHLHEGAVQYSVKLNGSQYVVLDSKRYGPYDFTRYPHWVLPEGPQFGALRDKKWFVVIGETEIGPYEELRNGGQSINNADEKPVYSAKLQDAWYVFWGTERHGPFLETSEPWVREGTLLFSAKNEEGWMVYHGSRTYGPYKKVGYELLIKDGKPYFGAQTDAGWIVVWGERTFGAFTQGPSWIRFADDQEPFFCVGHTVWRGGQEIARYDSIPCGRFNRDSALLIAVRGGRGYIQHNLESYGPYDQVCLGDGDSPFQQLLKGETADQPLVDNHLCYLAKSRGRWHVMRGRVTISSHDYRWATSLSFAEGKPLFKAGQKKGQEFVVWGDLVSGPFKSIVSGPWVIGGKVTALVRVDDRLRLIHGEEESYGPFDSTFSEEYDGERFACGALVGNMAYRIELGSE